MQVRTEHERAKHAALYVPVSDQPAYNLGKGSITTCKVARIFYINISFLLQTCTFSSEDGKQFRSFRKSARKLGPSGLSLATLSPVGGPLGEDSDSEVVPTLVLPVDA